MRLNKLQMDYIAIKAKVERLEAQKLKIESDYITSHNIVNADGSIPGLMWQIDDDAVFGTMMVAIGEELDALEIYKERDRLKKAEDYLLAYFLHLNGNLLADNKKLLEDCCFGWNGQYVHVDLRQKILADLERLDFDTIKAA